MASKSLSFLLFGEDVTAGKAFRKVAADAEKSGTSIKGAFSGGNILAVGALAAGLGLATKGAADFQTQMTRLVTAAGESQSNLKLVSDGVMKISSSTGTSLKATGDAMYYVESAGFHGAKGLEVLKAAAQGAKVEGADTKVVADALTTALTDLGKHAGPPAVVMSQLVETVSRGKMTMDDLAGSLHSVLPNAAAMGLSFGQVAGAIATMTAQGISADQATQNLNHTIISLKNPTAVMTKAMANFGLNSSTVSNNLGKAGLTGTLQELSTAILQHMGPAGLTLTNALNTSQIAAGKVTEGYKVLAPAAKAYFDAVVRGGKVSQDTISGTKGLTLAQSAQLKQLIVLYKQAHGFNALLKAGSPDALTYQAALAKMTGGMTGLQVATHLTGDNMATFNANVKDISSATTDAAGNVEHFTTKEGTLNQKTDELKTSFSNFVVEVGTQLIPVLTAAADFTLKHEKAVEILLGGFVGLKVATMAYGLAAESVAAVQGVAAAATKLFGTSAVTASAEVVAAKEGELAAVEAAAAGESAAMAEAGAASTIAMGPVGLAIGAVSLGLMVAAKHFGWFGSSAHAQVKPVEELTNAIMQDGDAIGKLTQQQINQKLSSDGAYDAALKLGVSQGTLLAAALGNARAQRVLIAAVNGAENAFAGASGATRVWDEKTNQWIVTQGKATQAQKVAKAAADALGSTVAGLSQQLAASKNAADNEAAATRGLSAAMRGVPKNITTSVSITGADYAKAVIRSITDYANSQNPVIHVTTTTSGGTFGGKQAFASGTDYVPRSGMYTVGEQGRETVFLPQGSKVKNASQTHAASMAGGSGLTVHVHVNTPLASPDQIARAVVPALANFQSRGGSVPWR